MKGYYIPRPKVRYIYWAIFVFGFASTICDAYDTPSHKKRETVHSKSDLSLVGMVDGTPVSSKSDWSFGKQVDNTSPYIRHRETRRRHHTNARHKFKNKEVFIKNPKTPRYNPYIESARYSRSGHKLTGKGSGNPAYRKTHHENQRTRKKHGIVQSQSDANNPIHSNIQMDNEGNHTFKKQHARDRRSNILLIMTDDLDVELGSLNYMPRLLRLLGREGAILPNAYTSTPMCCPSRSSMLTGMYIHNHEIYTNHKNCSGTHWQNTHEKRSFATYIRSAGYKTGYFGKYLNRYNGSHVPSGWLEWGGLITNSRYYNYSVNRNNHLVKYGSKYPQDYYPHVITNDGINFLRETQSEGSDAPFLLVLSYPSPHGPEDSSPEHAHRFFNASDHHTASYNYAPNPDKQWMLQVTDRMSDIKLKFTDFLMTKRLQTLQSVDEAIEKVLKELQRLRQMDNTYVFFTSDHGYHLGQFGLPKGKSMPFEFDIKVPLLVRGPKVKPGGQIPKIVLNIDLAPTFLDIAGVPRPPQMDGRSFLPIITGPKASKVKWRDSFLVESSGRIREEEEFEKKEQRAWERERALSLQLLKATSDPAAILNDTTSPSVSLYTSKHERFEEVCQRKEFASPCTSLQKWHCVKTGHRWRIKKCRRRTDMWKRHCLCQSPQGFGTFRKLGFKERKKQTNFLKKYLTKDLKSLDKKFIKTFSNVEFPNFPLKSNNFRKKRRKKHSKRNRRTLRELPSRAEGIAPTYAFTDVTVTDAAYIGSQEKNTGGRRPKDVAWGLSDHKAEYDTATDVVPSYGSSSVELSLGDRRVQQAFVAEEELRDLEDQIFEISDELQLLENVTGVDPTEGSFFPSDPSSKPVHGCQANGGRVDCREEVYENFNAWMNSKILIEDHIRRLRQQLAVMKNIHRHLQSKRPKSELSSGGDDDYVHPLEEGSGNYVLDALHDLFKDYGDDVENEAAVAPATEKQATDDGRANTYMTKFESDGGHRVHSGAEPYRVTQPKPKGGRLPLTVANGRKRPVSTDPTDRLYPVPLSSLVENVPVTDNDSAESMCWCVQRIARRMQLQEERAIKREERKKIKEVRQNRKNKRKIKNVHSAPKCKYMALNCYTHDNDHWKTPPLWTDGDFCFCLNAANNTYWCLRTINSTHNFLYCEFITGLITYYDLHIDPYQLRNVAFTLSNERVTLLHARLLRLRRCVGADACDDFASDGPPENSNLAVNSVAARPPFIQVPLQKRRKFHERQNRRKLRREKKMLKRRKLEAALLGLTQDQIFDSFSSSRKHKIRHPRKSRENTKRERKEKKRNIKGKKRMKIERN